MEKKVHELYDFFSHTEGSFFFYSCFICLSRVINVTGCRSGITFEVKKNSRFYFFLAGHILGFTRGKFYHIQEVIYLNSDNTW